MILLSKCHRFYPRKGLPRRCLFAAKSSSDIIDAFFNAGPTWSLQELSPSSSSPDDRMDHHQLEKLAELSHLDIPVDNRDAVIADVQAVLGMVSMVQEGAEGWDDSNVPSSDDVPIVASTPLRPDVVTVPDLSQEILSNAAVTESGYFVVPNTQGAK